MALMPPIERQGWQQRWTFIAASTGAAVGLGNLWKFSYLAGENGGAAFVLVYLASVFLLALPILLAEVIIGSRGRANPVSSLHHVALEAGSSRFWQIIAWLGVAASLLILSYYSVIAGWIFAYVEAMFDDVFIGLNVRLVGDHFNHLLEDPRRLIIWHSSFVALIVLIAAFGVKRGVARAARILIPVLIIALILLAVYASKIGDIDTALEFLFKPDWSALTPAMILAAMGQAFFTLSIGMGAMMAFGAHRPDRHSVVGMLAMVALLDTAVALLAGLAIFPLVFSLNIEPAMGPGLMFVALPYAFGQMVYGDFFGLLFFLMVACVSLTSGVALLEPVTAWLVERFNWWRPLAATAVGVLVWLLGLLTVFSLNLWADINLWGMGVFEWLDFISANILLPLGAWLIALFVGWWMRAEVISDEMFDDHPWIFSLWRLLLRYIAAPAVLVIFIVPLYQRLIG